MNQGFAGPGQCENHKIPSRSKTTTSYWHSQVLCRAFWGQRLFVASGQPQASRMAALELNRGESALSPNWTTFQGLISHLKLPPRTCLGAAPSGVVARLLRRVWQCLETENTFLMAHLPSLWCGLHIASSRGRAGFGNAHGAPTAEIWALRRSVPGVHALRCQAVLIKDGGSRNASDLSVFHTGKHTVQIKTFKMVFKTCCPV